MHAARMISKPSALSLPREMRVVAIPGDVTEATHRRALADAALLLGGLDAIVNSASPLGAKPVAASLDYPLDALEQVFARDTSSHRWGCCRRCAARYTPARASSTSPATLGSRPTRAGAATAPARRRSSSSRMSSRRSIPIGASTGRSRRHAYRNAPGSLPRRGHQRPPAAGFGVVPALRELIARRAAQRPLPGSLARWRAGESLPLPARGVRRATGRADR